MDNPIISIYRKVLWFLGFAKGEYITYMMKRQEQRLGLLWWFSIGITIGLITLFLHSWLPLAWFTILIFPIDELALLLVWHVVKTSDQDKNGTGQKATR